MAEEIDFMQLVIEVDSQLIEEGIELFDVL
jgi:hypothetical protein